MEPAGDRGGGEERKAYVIVVSIIIGNVPPHCAHGDQCQKAGQAQNDHDGVGDGEPVNLNVLHRQIRVPPGRPLHFTLVPADAVSP